MCQGVIVSLVKFPHKGKTKRVVLKGIGSHSNLVAENSKKLTKLGCKMDGQESIISIEPDFSAWNKFTVESGEPTKDDMAILAKAYKSCAGDATALLAHVKSIGRIDDALLSLLSQPAWAEYEKVQQPAWAEYVKVRQSANAEHLKVQQSANAERGKVWQSAYAEYEKERTKIWLRLFSKKENRVGRLQ